MESSCLHVPFIRSFSLLNIQAPSSKSHVIRVLFLAALQNHTTILKQVDYSEDVVAVLNVIKAMGAVVEQFEQSVKITGTGGQIKGGVYHCGESGLCVRIASVFSLLAHGPVTVTGKGTVLSRQFSSLIHWLKQTGLQITAKEHNYLPLNISGQVVSVPSKINASDTSQTASGLLLVWPFLNNNGSSLEVEYPVSKPYLEMTSQVLKTFAYSVNVETASNRLIYQINAPLRVDTTYFEIQALPDWSGLAFWMVAAAIGGDICFLQLQKAGKHTDAKIIDIMEQTGVDITTDGQNIRIKKSNITGFQFDATDYPDLFLPLVVLALWANGPSTINGVQRLVNKESNRALALQTELTKLGAQIDIQHNSMYIVPSKLTGGKRVYSYNDHRMVMTLSIVALFVQGGLIIDGAEAIDKSYPSFFSTLKKILVQKGEKMITC